MRKGLIGLTLAMAAAIGLAGSRLVSPSPLPLRDLADRLAQPVPAPTGPMQVFHLGHSLVGRDMPAMLTAMAPDGHVSHSQLGWGASLAQHWAGDVPGFDVENVHGAFRAAPAAVDSGSYDAIILTEMVELRDAIRFHDSAKHLARWAIRARAAKPDVRLYLYETWHPLTDPLGWETRVATDRASLWEGALLAPAMAREGVGTIHVIPAGQVLAAAVAAIEGGKVPGLATRHDLFSDDIHLAPAGEWLVALTHHAVLYHRMPDAGPSPVPRSATAPLRDIVWRTVSADPATGIAGAGRGATE